MIASGSLTFVSNVNDTLPPDFFVNFFLAWMKLTTFLSGLSNFKFQVLLPSQQLSVYKDYSSVYFYWSGIYILNFCKMSVLIKDLDLEMLGKCSTTSNSRAACTRLFFRALPTSTQCVPSFLVGRQLQLMQPKTFLSNPAHPVRLSIGTLQNLPSCFHRTRFKSITSIQCQRPLQKTCQQPHRRC